MEWVGADLPGGTKLGGQCSSQPTLKPPAATAWLPARQPAYLPA